MLGNGAIRVKAIRRTSYGGTFLAELSANGLHGGTSPA